MQIKHLKTFVTAAGTLSITRAADVVYLSQSSVSEQIQALESDLGAILFERGRRGLKLTVAGQALLEPAREMLRLADAAREAVDAAEGHINGTLRIGALESLCATRLPRLIARYREVCPEVEVSLTSAPSGELQRKLEAGELDAVFVYGEPAINRPYRSKVIDREALTIIVPKTNEAGNWWQLPFLRTEPGCVYRRMFDEALKEFDVRVAGDYGSLNAVVSLVEAGVGAALVPAPIVSGNQNVKNISPPKDVGEAAVSILWRHSRAQSERLTVMLAISDQAMASVDVQNASGGETIMHDEINRVGDVVSGANAAGGQPVRHGT